jgi:hypothetical protein
VDRRCTLQTGHVRSPAASRGPVALGARRRCRHAPCPRNPGWWHRPAPRP